MRLNLLRIVAAYCLLFSGTAFGQKSKVLEVKAWQGTLTSGINWEGQIGANTKYKIRQSISGTFVLDEFDPTLIYWFGFFKTGSVSHFEEAVTTVGGCVTTETKESVGGIVPDSYKDFRMAVSEFRPQWRLRYSIHAAMKTTRKTECPGFPSTVTVTERDSWTIGNVSWADHDKWLDLPETGTNLGFSATANFVCGNCVVSLNVPGWRIDVALSPLTASDLELEIDSAQYLTWRPTGRRDGGDGEPIEFTATLKRKDGSEPNQTVERFEWELIETSKEPGVAMNWPMQDPDKDFDMKLDPEVVTSQSLVRGPVDETAQKVISYLGPGRIFSDKLKVISRDWGGWSTLRVTAYTGTGTKIVGKFKGEKEEDVRLPDRDKGDLVAKSWRKEKAVSGKDVSDDENEPEGDGHKGDGLTLYEEYRGFYANGSHIEGDPKRKDYFAKNEAGTMGSGGLALFQRITGLVVHGKLFDEELAEDRIINRNYSAAPRLVDQHGVVLRTDSKAMGYAEARSMTKSPSTPRNITEVVVPTSVPGRPTASPAVSYSSATVAHELLHTVNVYHHGDEDEDVRWTRDSEGRLFEQSVTETLNDAGNWVEEAVGDKHEIRVFLESGEEVTSQARAGRRNLGIENGQHSGWENCVMRYDIADSYISRTGADVRYAGFRERPGVRLCDTSEGLDVNAEGRNPQSRYGVAHANRGKCKMQILVNDAVTPPSRK